MFADDQPGVLGGGPDQGLTDTGLSRERLCVVKPPLDVLRDQPAHSGRRLGETGHRLAQALEALAIVAAYLLSLPAARLLSLLRSEKRTAAEATIG
jgi:hypothetical protein